MADTMTANVACAVDFARLDHITRPFCTTHFHLNPSRIVPAGPIIDWDAPHGRSPLAG